MENGNSMERSNLHKSRSARNLRVPIKSKDTVTFDSSMVESRRRDENSCGQQQQQQTKEPRQMPSGPNLVRGKLIMRL